MRTKAQHAEKERYRNQGKRIWIAAYGPIPKDEAGRPFHIHHKDRNWRNNTIENLECVARKEHDAIHTTERKAWSAASLTKFTVGNQWGKANRGKIRTAEARAKISVARYGNSMSEETKRKIAASNIGKNKGRKKSADELARREASKASKRSGNPAYGNKWFNRTAKRRSSLSEEDILTIKARRDGGEGPSSIAKDYGVQPNSIWRICSGRRWKHI